MKKCPQCYRTYSDETLSFCLDDGVLLSASYNPQETGAPTFLLNKVDLPTDNAREISPAAESFQPPQRIAAPYPMTRPDAPPSRKGVGWLIYLAGLIISILCDLTFFYLINPLYVSATSDVYESISQFFENEQLGLFAASLLLRIPFNSIFYGLIAFSLGFIWSRARWRWGIVAVLPGFAITLYYMILNLSGGYFAPLYYFRVILSIIIYLLAGCFFSYLGSRLSEKNLNNPAHNLPQNRQHFM